jgi:hypothetical protein
MTEVTDFSLFWHPSTKQPSTGSVAEPLCFQVPSGRSAGDRSRWFLSLLASFYKAAIHRWGSRTSAKTSACTAYRTGSGNPKVTRFHPMPRAASHASTARAAWYNLPCGCLQLGLPEKPGCIPNSCSRLPEGNGCRSVSFQRMNPAGNRFLPPTPGPLQAGFLVSASNSGPPGPPTVERGWSADFRSPASRFPSIGFELRTADSLSRNFAFRRFSSTCKQVSEFRLRAPCLDRPSLPDTSTSRSEDQQVEPGNHDEPLNRKPSATILVKPVRDWLHRIFTGELPSRIASFLTPRVVPPQRASSRQRCGTWVRDTACSRGTGV